LFLSDLQFLNFNHQSLLNSAADFINYSLGCNLSLNRLDFSILLNVLYKKGEELIQHGYKGQMHKVDQVIHYIQNRYMENIGISQIAEEFNLTPNYLSTLFRKKTGTTFVKYLTHNRINKARELLAQNDMQIQQVAKEVGYFSTRHFTKLFTEIVGCYPSDYRKKLNE
jgi:two-component system, response regulator YesN